MVLLELHCVVDINRPHTRTTLLCTINSLHVYSCIYFVVENAELLS